MSDYEKKPQTSKQAPNELWVVIDPSDNDSVYSAPYEEACHEHINEAIGEDIDGAGSWVVRRFVLADEPPEYIAQVIARCRFVAMFDSTRRDARDTLLEAAEALQRTAEPPDDVQRDAERWRALIGCARVRVMGSAGLHDPQSSYAHIGVEFWTHHPAQSTPEAIETILKFVERAALTKTVRNEACLGDGIPCASDGSGGCVACDDGKGNYRPAVETPAAKRAIKHSASCASNYCYPPTGEPYSCSCGAVSEGDSHG